MSTDKELADKVVALGVGKHPIMLDIPASCFQANKDLYSINFSRAKAEAFVRDWRVAGALMEKCDTGEILIWQQKYTKATDVWIVETEIQDADARNESLPRAIIEACVEALCES